MKELSINNEHNNIRDSGFGLVTEKHFGKEWIRKYNIEKEEMLK